MLLITGLTGTSGSAFYDVLCREHYAGKIRVVVRKTTDRSMFENTPLDLEFAEGDISDVDFLAKAAEGCDMVFHIASKRKIQPLADAVSRSSTVRRAIMVSSTIVYSKCYRNSYLAEDEAVCRKKFEEHGIRYVFVRPTMIFGRPSDGNISRFIRWFLRWPVFPIVKGGKATIQPVSRLDLAEAYYLVLRHFDTLRQQEYVVSGEQEMTLREMFQEICDLAGRTVRFVNVPFPLAKLAVEAVYWGTGRKVDYREKLDRLTEDRAYGHDDISRELGYAPESFRERVRPLIEELKEQRNNRT